MRWLFVFLTSCLFGSVTAVTENDPSTLVEGVSVITGDFYLGEEDYVVAGVEPIPIRRYYLSAQGGIHEYPHLTATFDFLSNHLVVSEPNGTPILYSPELGGKPMVGHEFYGKQKRPFR